jgi:ubiquinone/menaquinone biosynthesis C-methylase UbiE
MDTKQAYNAWANQYDCNNNKTRDLEAIALRKTLADISFDNVLEVGCGTGKNTIWFIEKAMHVTAIDLSEEMLTKAKEKISPDRAQFLQSRYKK